MVLAEVVVQVILSVTNLFAERTKERGWGDVSPSDVTIQRPLVTEGCRTLLSILFPEAFHLAVPETAKIALAHGLDEESGHWESYAWILCAWHCG